MLAHFYGTPAKIGEIRAVCDAHGAVVVEDAAESLGAAYQGRPTGGLGDWGVVSFNGNNVFKIEGDVGFCNKVLKKSRLKTGLFVQNAQ